MSDTTIDMVTRRDFLAVALLGVPAAAVPMVMAEPDRPEAGYVCAGKSFEVI